MNSESNQEALQNPNKRVSVRSSLRKTSEDVPVPPPRRVSFAANSTVKPFVNDGDRTIWDNTYEEELNSAHSVNNLDATKMTANMSFTCCNFGNIVEKENIPPTTNRTTLELCDMELTNQFNDEDSEEPMDIDVANQTMFPQDDMSLTCKFPEVKQIESTSHNKNVVDDSMEFTCQFSTACNIITKPQQSEACSSMSEQNIEEEHKSILKNNIITKRQQSEACSSMSEQNIEEKHKSILKNNIITKRQQSEACSSMSEQNIEEKQKSILKNNIIMKPQQSEACSSMSEQNIEEEHKSILKNNIITKRQQSEACSSMSEQNIEEKQKSISRNNIITKPQQSETCSSMSEQNIEEEHKSILKNNIITKRQQSEACSSMSEQNIEEKQKSISRNNIITKPQQSETCSSMSEQNIEEEQEFILKTNDRTTEVVLQTLNEEVPAVNTESITEERETETVNSTTYQEVEIKEACKNEDETSLVNIINTHTDTVILEEQCDLVNSADMELSIAESTVDSTQALIEAASSVANNNSIDQMMESMNRILGNYQLITYQPVTVNLLTECQKTIKHSQEVLKKGKECLANYQPPTEFRLSCQLLTSTTSESESETNSLTSTDRSDSEQCLDSEVDEVVDLPKPLMDQIREVFNKSEPTDIKLIEIEEKTIFFTAFSESIWFRADLHEENDNVTHLTSLHVLNETSEDPDHSLCKFLVWHLMSKTQMDQLISSLGQSFDMLSLLEYLQMIIDNYYDFFWTFLMLQREFTSLKIDNNGTFTFDMVCSRSQTWWTIEFKMSSPEHFQLDSLKVTSKWSDISSRQRRFTGIMMNVESGVECLKNFVKAIKDYFQKTIESFPTVNKM